MPRPAGQPPPQTWPEQGPPCATTEPAAGPELRLQCVFFLQAQRLPGPHRGAGLPCPVREGRAELTGPSSRARQGSPRWPEVGLLPQLGAGSAPHAIRAHEEGGRQHAPPGHQRPVSTASQEGWWPAEPRAGGLTPPHRLSPQSSCPAPGPLGRPTVHRRDTLGRSGWQRRRGQHLLMKKPHSPRHPSLSCDRKKAMVFPGRLRGHPESAGLARLPHLLLQGLRRSPAWASEQFPPPQS